VDTKRRTADIMRIADRIPEHGFAEANSVAMSGVVHPAADAGADTRQIQLVMPPLSDQPLQPPSEMDPFPALEPPPFGEHEEAEERHAFGHWARVRRAMDGQSQPAQALDHRFFPLPEQCRVVAEEEKVSLCVNECRCARGKWLVAGSSHVSKSNVLLKITISGSLICAFHD
jgi:hypothetical protein